MIISVRDIGDFCTICTSTFTCGFCASNLECLSGGEAGPIDGIPCPEWFFGKEMCPGNFLRIDYLQ
jgi:hypothetical protein